MMARFGRWLEKILDFGQAAVALQDSRPRPQIPTAAIWLSAFFMAVPRLGSLNALRRELQTPRRLEALIGPRKPSADTIGRGMEQIPPEQLRAMPGVFNHRLRRNKTLEDNPWPLRFAILDVEMIAPGEGETTAARRLVARLLQDYARFFDAVCGDALYLEGPLFNLLAARGKHALAVLKGNNPALLADARGALGDEPAQSWPLPRGRGNVQCREGEEFRASAITPPLRVIHTAETLARRWRSAGAWREETEIHDWWWATTIGAELMPARQLWQVGHQRWDIENKIFNTMSMSWGLDHCFHHQPQAILNFILTLLIAFELLHCFQQRNLKEPARRGLELIALARQLSGGLTEPGGWRAPWLAPPVHAPP